VGADGERRALGKGEQLGERGKGKIGAWCREFHCISNQQGLEKDEGGGKAKSLVWAGVRQSDGGQESQSGLRISFGGEAWKQGAAPRPFPVRT
jgi:hypothetical protein